MLYIASMGCSRISVCLLIKKILPGTVPKYTALVFVGFTAVWMTSGMLVTAFACNLPHPWNFIKKSGCYDVVAFVNYVGITNIIVEVLLVILPLVVWNVRISTTRRTSVSLVFLARLRYYSCRPPPAVLVLITFSVVAAVGAHVHFFNHSNLSDLSYNYWPAVLSRQIAQNLAIVAACLPCLHPFIIKVLAGTIEPETFSYKCSSPAFIKHYLNREPPGFDPGSSQSSRASMMPLAEKLSEPYCRPLATYGLDCSSNHRHTISSSRFPSNIAKPIFGSRPPENVFNRHIEVPQSRPATSTSATDPLAAPRNLRDVGVLPTLEWDTESSKSGGSRRSSPARYPTTEYILNRQQVISVPEESHLYDDESKRFAPPLPSPRSSQQARRPS
jgi:hypothetical protein